jgi:phosphoribosylformylglycinamidine cyclo-ligase
VPELGCSVGEELLKVHLSYGPLVQALLKSFNKPRHTRAIKGLAHITGGGFIDNIPRVLPKDCDVAILKGTWPVLPVFELIQRYGKVDEKEMHQVFNMGIGMMAIVSGQKADGILRSIRRRGHQAWIIGEVRKGRGKVKLVS